MATGREYGPRSSEGLQGLRSILNGRLWRWMLCASPILSVVFVVAGGCTGGNDVINDPAQPRFGFVQVALTDNPLEEQGVTAVNVCIERVDLIFADGQPKGTLDVSRTINLLDLQGGVTTSLGIERFPVGLIQQVRLILCPDGASVVINGEEVPVKVPSGEQTGIKLLYPGGFEVSENTTTLIVLDFDAEKSVHRAGNKWMLTPVVQIVEKAIVLAVTEPSSDAFVRPLVTVRGTVASKEPLASLTVNDIMASVDGLSWETDIFLPEGPGTIHVEAADQQGRTAFVAIHVQSDDTPPAINISGPPNNEGDRFETFNASFRLRGRVTDAGHLALAEFSVCGNANSLALDSEGNFDEKILLDEPEAGALSRATPITIRAVDAAGNTSTFAVEVVRLLTNTPGEFIVTFDAGRDAVDDANVVSALNAVGGVLGDVLHGNDNLVAKILVDAITPADSVILALEAQPGVLKAAPNAIGTYFGVPDDPRFEAEQEALQHINAPAAWDVTTGSQHVVVAVIDTGLDVAHPELYRNVWINVGELPVNYLGADFDGDGLITFNDLNCDVPTPAWPPCDDPIGAADFKVDPNIEIIDFNGSGYIDAEDFLLCLVPSGEGGNTARMCDVFDDIDSDENGVDDDLFGANFGSAVPFLERGECSLTEPLGGCPFGEGILNANLNRPNDVTEGGLPDTANPLTNPRGHGTLTAGLIGAAGDNAFGIAGMNWRVRIIPLLNGMIPRDGRERPNAFATAQCLNYARQGTTEFASRQAPVPTYERRPVPVVSLATGFITDIGGTLRDALLAMDSAPVPQFLAMAAGNGDLLRLTPVDLDAVDPGTQNSTCESIDEGESCNKVFPMVYRRTLDLSNTLVVGASVVGTSGSESRLGITNFGEQTVDLFAPVGFDGIASTAAGGRDEPSAFKLFENTSAATPLVSGTAALMVAANPALFGYPAGLAQHIRDTVTSVDPVKFKSVTGGRLDSAAAVGSVIGDIPFPLHQELPQLEIAVASATEFGLSVAVGDVSCDGMEDLLVGARDAVYVFFGNGDSVGAPDVVALPYSSTQLSHASFGEVVDVIGDLDGDGCSEFLVASPQRSPFPASDGSVSIYKGTAAPGTIDPSIVLKNPGFVDVPLPSGPAPIEQFFLTGFATSAVGAGNLFDECGGGSYPVECTGELPDIAVGAPGSAIEFANTGAIVTGAAGMVALYSGRTLATILAQLEPGETRMFPNPDLGETRDHVKAMLQVRQFLAEDLPLVGDASLGVLLVPLGTSSLGVGIVQEFPGLGLPAEEPPNYLVFEQARMGASGDPTSYAANALLAILEVSAPDVLLVTNEVSTDLVLGPAGPPFGTEENFFVIAGVGRHTGEVTAFEPWRGPLAEEGAFTGIWGFVEPFVPVARAPSFAQTPEVSVFPLLGGIAPRGRVYPVGDVTDDGSHDWIAASNSGAALFLGDAPPPGSDTTGARAFVPITDQAGRQTVAVGALTTSVDVVVGDPGFGGTGRVVIVPLVAD